MFTVQSHQQSRERAYFHGPLGQSHLAEEFIAAQWQRCPNASGLTGGGDVVLIDGAGRPIVKIYAHESTENLLPDAAVSEGAGCSRARSIPADPGRGDGPRAFG